MADLDNNELKNSEIFPEMYSLEVDTEPLGERERDRVRGRERKNHYNHNYIKCIIINIIN